jgi:hypothetical protein
VVNSIRSNSTVSSCLQALIRMSQRVSTGITGCEESTDISISWIKVFPLSYDKFISADDRVSFIRIIEVLYSLRLIRVRAIN